MVLMDIILMIKNLVLTVGRSNSSVISVLTLGEVGRKEEGEYTCLPTMHPPVTVQLHVLGNILILFALCSVYYV